MRSRALKAYLLRIARDAHDSEDNSVRTGRLGHNQDWRQELDARLKADFADEKYRDDLREKAHKLLEELGKRGYLRTPHLTNSPRIEDKGRAWLEHYNRTSIHFLGMSIPDWLIWVTALIGTLLSAIALLTGS